MSFVTYKNGKKKFVNPKESWNFLVNKLFSVKIKTHFRKKWVIIYASILIEFFPEDDLIKKGDSNKRGWGVNGRISLILRGVNY